MPDDMFMSADRRSLRRGRRTAPRTEICRPCLVWLKDAPDSQSPGVVLDMNAYGLRIRMYDILPVESSIYVQMMRDDEFKEPLADPVEAMVARVNPDADGFVDHGVRILLKELKRTAPRSIAPTALKPKTAPKAQRMYTLDVTVGERIKGKIRRERG